VRLLYLADIRFPLERANGIQSIETCHALASRGHHVTLAVRPDTHQPVRDPFEFYGLPKIQTLGIEVVPVAGPAAARRTGYLTFALGRAAGRARQDLIFTRDLGVASLLLHLPSALRAPLVYEGHGIASETAAALPQLVTGAAAPSAAKLRRLAGREERVWRSADGYVTITSGLAREMARRFGERPRVAVVPDGVRLLSDPTMAASTSPAAGGDAVARSPFTIGYAGHLYPWKGVELIVEAVAALPDTRALIIGGHTAEPDLGRVREFAQQLDCASRVEFTGHLPPLEARRRLRDADVLALPNPASAISTEFTSPLKLFEYMAAGRPIIASNLPSIREVLRDDENAVLVEPGNPQAFTAGIRRLKEDPTTAERLARQALEDVQQYTWDARAEKLEDLFRQVAG
jgi:glycosyltransferase involved in cell wall biosynthesis